MSEPFRFERVPARAYDLSRYNVVRGDERLGEVYRRRHSGVERGTQHQWSHTCWAVESQRWAPCWDSRDRAARELARDVDESR